MASLTNGFPAAFTMTRRPSAIETARRDLRSLPILIDDTTGLTPSMLAKRAEFAVTNPKIGAKVIVVDYLQLMNSDSRGDRYHTVTDVSMALAHLRKELQVPIIALAQLNRKSVDRATVTDYQKFVAETGRANWPT